MLQAYYKGTNIKVRAGETIRTTSGQEMIFVRATRKTEIGKSGKITTTNGMEYYAHIFNIVVKEYDEHEEKYIFVTEELTQLAQSINNKVERMIYEYNTNGRKEEIVMIDFTDIKKYYREVINVTDKSLKEITLNVIKLI